MMLIELALLCLTRAAFFRRLTLLDTQGHHSAISIDRRSCTPFLAQMKTFSPQRGSGREARREGMPTTSPTWRALGQIVLVYFAVGGAAVTAQDTQPGRATFVEMIAFARLASIPCQRLAPDADSFHARALRRLVQPPITAEEIAAKEKDIKRLRVRLGLSRWCKRYAGQMEQARILVQVLRRQN
jgi:hypothetical protein